MNRLLLVLTLLLSACQILPDLSRRSVSTHLDLPASPQLQNALLPAESAPASGKLSDIYLLDDPHNAFVARAALIQSAQKTLDIQYYIWKNDISGKLMIQMLRQAAQRGVRVRLLLDDNNTPGLDNLLALLNQEPNIEVRLFNPFANRNFRALCSLFICNCRFSPNGLTATPNASGERISGILLPSTTAVFNVTPLIRFWNFLTSCTSVKIG